MNKGYLKVHLLFFALRRRDRDSYFSGVILISEIVKTATVQTLDLRPSLRPSKAT